MKTTMTSTLTTMSTTTTTTTTTMTTLTTMSCYGCYSSLNLTFKQKVSKNLVRRSTFFDDDDDDDDGGGGGPVEDLETLDSMQAGHVCDCNKKVDRVTKPKKSAREKKMPSCNSDFKGIIGSIVNMIFVISRWWNNQSAFANRILTLH